MVAGFASRGKALQISGVWVGIRTGQRGTHLYRRGCASQLVGPRSVPTDPCLLNFGQGRNSSSSSVVTSNGADLRAQTLLPPHTAQSTLPRILTIEAAHARM